MKRHVLCWAQYWDQHTRDKGIVELEKPQRWLRNWSPKFLRRNWESCYSAWGREGSGGKLNSTWKYLMGRCNERETGSSQRCPDTGQETRDKLNYKVHSDMTITLLYFKDVQAFNEIVQRGSGSLQPWRYFQPDWTHSWTICSNWCCSAQGYQTKGSPEMDPALC